MTDESYIRFGHRLYDWLLRKRLIREPQWGQPGLSQRLLRIRFLSAFLLSLPAIVLCIWYASAALLAHLRHQAEVNAKEPLTVRLVHLHLHDKLLMDWHRLIMPEPQHKSPLPTYGLVVRNEKLDQLASQVFAADGEGDYVDGLFVKGNHVLDVQLRYRGGSLWHYSQPQNSWQVKVKDGKVFEGLRNFSFVNSTGVAQLEETIILDIARELGLVTADFSPVRLLLNKSYMGVYFLEAPADEGSLRRAQRPQGSIYSGGGTPSGKKVGMHGLFESADNFTKAVQGVHQQLGEREELEALIDAVNDPGAQMFARFAESHLDLDKFAKLDALDVIFGCSRRAAGDDYRIYFDPVRSRFEPIARNFRDCQQSREFNCSENSLSLRLNLLPDYVARRNRIVYDLLHNVASPETIRKLTLALIDKLEPDQARDPYWDANQLLPNINPYHASLLRPTNRELQNTAVETRMFGLGIRSRHLTNVLEEQNLSAALSVNPSAALTSNKAKKKEVTFAALDLTVGGSSAYSVTQLSAYWPNDCRPDHWRLYADTNFTSDLELEQDRELGGFTPAGESTGLSVELYSGSRMESRSSQGARAQFHSIAAPRHYRFFIVSDGCAPVGATIYAKSLVTDANIQLSAHPKAALESATGKRAQCEEKYGDQAGQKSPHPWCSTTPAEQTVALGPGTVDVTEPKTFAPNQSVVIAPDTTFRIAPGASVVFTGKVTARGTAKHPITFEALDRTWGGLAIQGLATTGSRFDYVHVKGGSRPESVLGYWPGMVNVHDTADIAFNHCTLSGPRSPGVALHVAETKGLGLDSVTIRDASGKALVLEFVSGTLNDISVLKSAGDAITLTGSQVAIKNSKVLAWQGDGISVNQRSDVSLFDVVLAGGSRGLFVQEASTVQYDRLLLLRNDVGLGLDATSDWYSGKAHIKGQDLFALDCKEKVQKQGRRQKILGQINDRLGPDDLVQIRTNVLRAANWADVDARMTQLLTGESS